MPKLVFCDFIPIKQTLQCIPGILYPRFIGLINCCGVIVECHLDIIAGLLAFADAIIGQSGVSFCYHLSLATVCGMVIDCSCQDLDWWDDSIIINYKLV